MTEDCQNGQQNTSSRKRYPRKEILGRVIAFEEAKEKLGLSQRDFAKMKGIPQSTLQQWIHNKATVNAPPEVVAFLESPAGFLFMTQAKEERTSIIV